MVKKLVSSQEDQINRLMQLEARVGASPRTVLPHTQRPQESSDSAVKGVVCYHCGKPGHIARLCRTVMTDEAAQAENGAVQAGFKCVGPVVTGATTDMQQSPQQHVTGRSKPADTPLVGPCNEGVIGVNGEMCKALIDSGSQVTTITDEFWRQHPLLCTQELQPSDIPIDGATG